MFPLKTKKGQSSTLGLSHELIDKNVLFSVLVAGPFVIAFVQVLYTHTHTHTHTHTRTHTHANPNPHIDMIVHRQTDTHTLTHTHSNTLATHQQHLATR